MYFQKAVFLLDELQTIRNEIEQNLQKASFVAVDLLKDERLGPIDLKQKLDVLLLCRKGHDIERLGDYLY